MGKTKIMQLSSPDLMKVLLMLTIALVSFPILHIFAQQGDSNTDTSMSLYLSQAVNSVALLVGVAVPLIVSGLAYVKAKSQDPKIEEAAYTAIHVGQIATLTANKVLENKQHIKEVLEVGLVLAPEDRRYLRGQPAEHLPVGIDHEPLPFDFAFLRHQRRQFSRLLDVSRRPYRKICNAIR